MRDALLQSFDWVLAASWQSALIAIAVGVVQQMIGRKLSPAFRAAIWSLVLIRLALPVLPSSRFSLFNLFQPSTHTVRNALRQSMPSNHRSSSALFPIQTSKPPKIIPPLPFLHAKEFSERGFDFSNRSVVHLDCCGDGFPDQNSRRQSAFSSRIAGDSFIRRCAVARAA